MANTKYEPIYQTIRREILSGQYAHGDLLPSENEYCVRFGCTRNTVRRALAMIAQEGLAMPIHGRGVQVIRQIEPPRNIFSLGGIESLKEAAERNHCTMKTRVLTFREMICDKAMSDLTGFDEGKEIYYIERVRRIDDQPVILDTSCFLKSETEGLSRKIAAKSIYEYLENTLGLTITTSLRRVTAEKAGPRDFEHLDMQDYDFLLVITGQVFHSGGVMFEYTQSRHRPDKVCFIESAVRRSL